MKSIIIKIVIIIVGLFFVSRLIYFRRIIFAHLPFFKSHTLTVRVCNPFTGNLEIVSSLSIYPQEPYSKKQRCEIKEESDGCKIAKCQLLEGVYLVSSSGGYTGSEVVNLNSDKQIKLDLFGPISQH